MTAEREQRYGKALGWRRDAESGAIRAMLDEQVQRVMSVADAEQAELSRKLDGLRELRIEDYARVDRAFDRAHSAEDAIRRIRALHQSNEKTGLCVECQQGMPCDTLGVLDGDA